MRLWQRCDAARGRYREPRSRARPRTEKTVSAPVAGMLALGRVRRVYVALGASRGFSVARRLGSFNLVRLADVGGVHLVLRAVAGDDTSGLYLITVMRWRQLAASLADKRLTDSAVSRYLAVAPGVPALLRLQADMVIVLAARSTSSTGATIRTRVRIQTETYGLAVTLYSARC